MNTKTADNHPVESIHTKDAQVHLPIDLDLGAGSREVRPKDAVERLRKAKMQA